MEPDPTAAAKAALRTRLLAARRAVPDAVRAAEALALAGHVRALARRGTTVCAYVPVGREPGSDALLDAVRDAGARLLLPVAREPGPLGWAEHTGALVAAPHGLREPAGPALPPRTVAEAELVLVPALALDRAGGRLGRGAGFYDRTLGLAGAGARLVGVVRDAELLAAVPTERHDVRLGWALTPDLGLTGLGAGATDGWHSAR